VYAQFINAEYIVKETILLNRRANTMVSENYNDLLVQLVEA